jgi:hypothetical protein
MGMETFDNKNRCNECSNNEEAIYCEKVGWGSNLP